MTADECGRTMHDALLAAVECSGRLDRILPTRRRKRNRARYRAGRNEARREAMRGSVG